MGFEPTTFCLASKNSTPELHPQLYYIYYMIYSNNIPGQFDQSDFIVIQLLSNLLQKNASIVEYGAHFGRATVAWLDNIDPSVTLTSIDHWEYTDLDKREYYYKGFDLNNLPYSIDDCLDDRYKIFLYYTKKYLNSKSIKTHFPPSDIDLFKKLKQLDLIFIDGNHEYESIKFDCEFWYPRLKKDTGIICGHDYKLKYDGVVKFINEFSLKNNKPLLTNIIGTSSMWIMFNDEKDYLKFIENSKIIPSKIENNSRWYDFT